MDVFNYYGLFVIICVFSAASSKVHNEEVTESSHVTQNPILLTSVHDVLVYNNPKLLNETYKGLPESKEKKGSGSENPLVRLIPMLAMPFIIQTIFLPMILLGIKVMLLQSIVLGKFAIFFWLINLIRHNLKDQNGQLYSHNVHVGHG